MKPFAWTAALHHEFSLSVALSVALHGLVGIALGAFTLSTQVAPTPLDGLKVELVALEPEPPAPSPALQASPRSLASSSALAPTAPDQPVEQAAEPAPSFRDVPRVLAPAASPTAAFPETVAFSAPEPAELPFLLSESKGTAPLSRAVPIATSGPARLLRDNTAQAGSVRSKVRFENNPRPEYPRAAREAGWEGTTVLQVLVLPDGRAGSVTLHRTSGYAVLDEAALTAIKAWRFIPAMDGNFPIKSVVRLPIRFDLKESS